MAKKALQKKLRTPSKEEVQRLTISIPKPLYDEVERIATRDSRSLGWVIRKAIEVRVNDESPLLTSQQ